MKIYIAGKITGFEGYKEKFADAEKYILDNGDIALNPSILPKGFEQEEYLQICFSMIDVCQAVYFLDNWKDSSGAKSEHAYAKKEGKAIFYESILG